MESAELLSDCPAKHDDYMCFRWKTHNGDHYSANHDEMWNETHHYWPDGEETVYVPWGMTYSEAYELYLNQKETDEESTRGDV